MGTLDGKVALVTGGGRGIGRSSALELAARGAAVAVAARSMDEVEAVAAEVRAEGVRAHAVSLDVASPASVEAAVASVRAALGPVSVLVNNAGIAPSAPFEKTDLALWNQVLAVNLTGTYLVTHACLPDMLRAGWGRVVNVASVAAKVGFSYVTAYCASKHGVLGLTRALAHEVARKGVTVNAVCPGYVDTKITRDARELIQKKTGLSDRDALQSLETASPQRRLMTEDEVARLVAFLAEPGQAGINGQGINLDGGGVTS